MNKLTKNLWGDLLNERNEVYSIIHQVDRSPMYKKYLVSSSSFFLVLLTSCNRKGSIQQRLTLLPFEDQTVGSSSYSFKQSTTCYSSSNKLSIFCIFQYFHNSSASRWTVLLLPVVVMNERCFMKMNKLTIIKSLFITFFQTTNRSTRFFCK